MTLTATIVGGSLGTAAHMMALGVQKRPLSRSESSLAMALVKMNFGRIYDAFLMILFLLHNIYSAMDACRLVCCWSLPCKLLTGKGKEIIGRSKHYAFSDGYGTSYWISTASRNGRR